MARSQTDSPASGARHPAVFLDRDNTLIEDPGYIDHPDKVRLLPGAAAAVRRLREAGYRVVVVSNQSGVARGLFSEAQLASIHARLGELLAGEGTRLDAIYYCPYLDGPDAVVERYRRTSELRKPSPGMLLQAAADLAIDLRRSWMVGDGQRDIEAGRRAGCRTVLIESGGQRPEFKGTKLKGAEFRGSKFKGGQAAAKTDLGLEESPGGGHNVALEPDFRAGSLAAAAVIILGAKTVEDASTPQPPDSPDDTAPNPSRDTAAPDGTQTLLLRNIRDLLNREQRTGRQTDFSFLRLLATLMQMLAISAAIAGVFSLLDRQDAAATARFALATFLQVVTVTAYVLDRDRR